MNKEGGMESPVHELERILKNEIDIYDELASIEAEKTGLILARDGMGLESYAQKQEHLLMEISELEKKRQETISRYREEYHLDETAVSLHDVVRNMDEDSALRLMRCGMELKKNVLRMQSLSETNGKLIEDNMEFFNILLSGLKNSVSLHTGYTREGSSARVTGGSLLFNKTV
jgi:hypothetical protein